MSNSEIVKLLGDLKKKARNTVKESERIKREILSVL